MKIKEKKHLEQNKVFYNPLLPPHIKSVFFMNKKQN